MTRLMHVYIVPAAVFVSVIMGGGYGTGREVVEFFSRYGVNGGLIGIGVATVVFSLVLGLTFDFARRTGAYEYREFFKHLIGPLWWTFEVLYLLLFLLVLGVLSSAASNLLNSMFGVSENLGLILMLALVALMVFFGREILERILTGWMFFMYAVILLYFVFVMRHFNSTPFSAAPAAPVEISAYTGGALYALYNVSLAPVLLFAVRGLASREEAFGCGLVTAILIMLPAAMFHISFAFSPSEVLDQPVPVFWMIQEQGPDWLLKVYLVALLGTLAQTGAGLVQGVIERVEFAIMPDRDDGMSHWLRSFIAVIALTISAGLASIGIIGLIAQGYSAMAVGFAVVYVIPLLLFSHKKTKNTH